MIKWRLMLTSLPIAFLAVLVKWLLSEYAHFQGFVELSDISLIISAGVFLIGFMLAGTLSDYKESERIPGEIASALESIEETCVNLATKTNQNTKAMSQAVHTLAVAIHNCFMKKIPTEQLYDELYNFNQTINFLDSVNVAATILGRVFNELSLLRRIITRASVISKTGFLETGYALLEILLMVMSCILMIVKFKNFVAAMVVVFFITLVYVYMYRLIKDIDDPFEYDENSPGGAADVALFPITEYIARVEKRIQEK